MVVDLQTANFLPELNEIKIVVVGARKVGKSASVVRFLTNRFINEYCENTDMNCPGRVNIDGSSLSVNILDTSDKGMRTASVEHSIRWADAIIFVYSVTDRESFRCFAIKCRKFGTKATTRKWSNRKQNKRW